MSAPGAHAYAVFASAFVLAVAGCASPHDPTMADALIAPSVRFALPAPTTLGRRVDSVQLVTAEFAGQKILFDARISVGAERMTLVGTDPAGRRALTVEYVDGAYQAQKADWLPSRVKPESVLADLILIYWPRAALAQALAPNGVDVIDASNKRFIRKGETPLVTIQYLRGGWRGHARLNNHSWGYSVEVRSSEVGR
jgi:hypothetical protein